MEMKAKNDFKMYVRALFWMPFCFCSLFMCFQSPPVTIHQAVPSLHPAYPARSHSSILIKLVQGLLHCVKNFMLSMLRFAGFQPETVFPPSILFAKSVLCKHEQIGILQILGENTKKHTWQSWQSRSCDRKSWIFRKLTLKKLRVQEEPVIFTSWFTHHIKSRDT